MARWNRSASAVAALLLAANVPVPEEPMAPDYYQAKSWAAAARDEGAAAFVAPGATRRSKRLDANVACIRPMTGKSSERRNTPVDDAQVNALMDGSVVAALNACCRIFAPGYRRATSGTGRTTTAVRNQTTALAYGDVRRALAYYPGHWNHGR